MRDKVLLQLLLSDARKAKKENKQLYYEIHREGARNAKRRRLWRGNGPFGYIVTWYESFVKVEFDPDTVIRAINRELKKIEES